MNRKALFRFLPVKFSALLAPLLAAWPMQSPGAVATWTGGDATGNWSAPLNWGGVAVAANDEAHFAGITNIITNNDIAALTLNRIFFDTGAANFSLTGNGLTLVDVLGLNPQIVNNSLHSTQFFNTGAITLDGTAGSLLADIQAAAGNILFANALNLTGATRLSVSTGTGRVAQFNGAITLNGGGAAFGGTGFTVLNAANTFASGQTITFSGGKAESLNASALGGAAAASNANIAVAAGAQVDFNGIALTNNGKNFTIAGAGPDGTGALVNHYQQVDAQKAINNLTLSANATIGGTKGIDIGGNTAGQTLDGGGFTLTLNTRNRFNIRTPNIVNLPQIIVNSGNVETEGVDVPAATAVTLNGAKSTLGAWLGGAGTIRTWAGDITLNNGAGIGGIGTGGAANTLVIGSAGKTLTINGEGRLNANTNGFIDWVDIGGAGNMRVESTLAGSGKLVIGQWGTGTNGTTVTLTQDNPAFSGNVQISAGTLALGNGGATGNLGTAGSVDFVNGGGTPLLSINRTGPVTFNNSFSGPGSIHIDNAAAVVTLNGANTTGGAGVSVFATRVRAGTLNLGAANALSPRATFEIGGLGVGIGSLTRLNGFSPVVERFDDATTDTAGVFNRVINDSATYATLTFNINNAGPAFGDFGGTLGGTTANENNFGITKIGANDWSLAGSAHTYTGLTTVNGGTLRLANDTTGGAYGIGKLGSSTGLADGTVINPGGSFEFNGFSAGDEWFSISGRGNAITTHGFEAGALRGNAATAAAVTSAVKFISLAGNASIGKNGTAADANAWDLRNTGSAAVLSLNGFTLRKVGNITVNLADVTGGTGDGDINVLHGTLGIERGTVVNGTGTITVNTGATLNLNDNGTPVSITKSLALNAGTLTNTNGSHSFPGLGTNGYFSAQNNSAADVLDLGSVTAPLRGHGAFVVNTGTVNLGAVNGVTDVRPGPGWTVGGSAATAVLAQRSGSSLVPITTTANTGVGDLSLLTGQDVLANSAADADRTITADLTLRSLTSRADVKVNNGALLRIDEGSITMNSAAHWLQTTAGASMGRLTSGRADGELHLNLPSLLDSGPDTQVRLQITNNPVTAGPAAGSFVPNLLVKNGAAGLSNLGGSNFAAPSTNTQNDYTAGTIINAGRVVPAFGNAFGTGPVTVRDGGQLATFSLTAANGAHISNALNLAGAGAFENAGFLGAVRLNASTTLSGNTLLSANTRLTPFGAGDVGTMAGVMRGAGGVDKTGDGFAALTAPNTYTGSTTVTRGTLVTNRLANGGLASGIGASSNAASSLVLNGGTLRYDGPSTSTDRGFTVDIQGGTINSNYHTGGLTLNPAGILMADAGDRTLTLFAANFTSNVLNGVVSDPNAGRTSLTFGGLGTWRILRDQTFSGVLTVSSSATSVQGGTLLIGDGGTSGSIGNGVAISLANASDLAFNRSDSVTVNHAITSAANSEVIQLGTGTLTLGGNADNGTNNVRIENGGTMVLAKNSNLNVHAVSTNAFVNNGTLRLAGSGDDQIANNTTVYMRSAATFDLNGRYETVARVEGTGGVITNSAAGTTAELRVGGAGNNSASVFTGSFIPGVIGATGTGGFHGVIQDGAGTVKVSKDGTGLVALNGNNTYSGGTEILQGTLQVGRGGGTGSLGSGPVFLGGGDYGTNGNNVGTLRVDRTGTLVMNQTISGPGNVEMRGEGELRLTGANSWDGVTVLRRGTLTADLGANDNVLPVTAGYNLEGGTLNIVGRAGGGAVQNFLPANIAITNVSGSGTGAAQATFNIQGGNIRGDNNGGTLTVNLPTTLTRGTGGSVDFATAGAGTTTFRTGAAGVNTILSSATAAYATYNGTSWATQSGGQIIGLAAGGYNTAAGHLDLPSGTTPSPGGTIGATVRFNTPGAATINLLAPTNLAQGGVLITPNVGANTIVAAGSTITASGNELIIHQHNTAGDLEIQSTIGGATATSLVKAGPGRLILTGANNTNTAGTFINQGTLMVGGTAGTLPAGAILNDASLVIARTNGTFATPWQLATTNVISGSGSLTVQGGSGWVDFNKINHTFTGGTTISSGYVQNFNNNSGQVAPVVLGDASTGSQPVALVSNHTAVTNYNFPVIVPAGGGTGPVLIGSSGGTGAVAAFYNGTLDLNRPTTLVPYHPDRTTFTNSITGNVGTLTIDVFDSGGNPLLPGAVPAAIATNARRITLEGTNTFVGNVEVRNGSVLQLGLGTAGVFRDQIPDASDISLFGTGSMLTFNYEGEVINNLNGQVGTTVRSVAAGGAWTVLSVNGGTFDGSYDGSGMYLEKNGSGTLSLGGTADNPGGKVRMNSGTLILNKASTATVHAVAVELTQNGGTTQITGAGDDQIYDGSVLTLNGGTFDLNGRNETIAIVQGLGGIITNTAVGTTSTLSIGSTISASAIASSVFYGAIDDGAGAVRIVKNNSVAHGLVLTGDSTYSGGTDLQAGVLQLGNGGTAGTAGTGPITTAANTRVVLDHSNNWTVPNDISGAASLTQQGGGIVTLTGSNSYTGLTTINHGATLRIGNGGITGTLGTGSISNFGELSFNRSDTMTVSQSIADLPADMGIVRQAGTGKTILTGVSNYYGDTMVDAGTLQVDGKILTSTIYVNAGGRLGGNGTTGPVNVNGGTFAPGASPGILTTGGVVTTAAGSTFAFEVDGLTPGTQYDQAVTNGTINLGSAVSILTISTGYTPAIGDSVLIWMNDGSDPVSGTFNGLLEGGSIFIPETAISDDRWIISYMENALPGADGNDISLRYVPEPSGVLLAAGAGLFALTRRRRRS